VRPRETDISSGLYERLYVHSQAIIFGPEYPLNVTYPIIVTTY